MWSEAAGDHQWLALTTPHAAHTKLGKHDASNEVRSAVAQQVYVLRHAGAGTAHAGNNNNTPAITADGLFEPLRIAMSELPTLSASALAH